MLKTVCDSSKSSEKTVQIARVCWIFRLESSTEVEGGEPAPRSNQGHLRGYVMNPDATNTQKLLCQARTDSRASCHLDALRDWPDKD